MGTMEVGDGGKEMLMALLNETGELVMDGKGWSPI